MAQILNPTDEAELRELIASANSANTPLEIIGHATKRGLGHPVAADVSVDMQAFSAITLYEPEELVLSAKAGTPISEISSALGAQNQMLAFEPWDPAFLLGQKPASGTIGGTFMAGLAGPRRPGAGAARDNLLGVNAINGQGEIFKTGGRVVKNVSGFDLPKLIAGSFGTLAIATELTFKVLPRPEKARTLLIFGLNALEGGRAMRIALTSPHEVSATAHLPQSAAALAQVEFVRGAGTSVTAIRVEGPGPSVSVRIKALRELLSTFGDIEELHTENSIRLWSEIRDVQVLTHNPDKQVWRISVAPTDGPRLANWAESNIGADALLDWGGGLLWLALDATPDAHASDVRGAISSLGGHATLVRATADVRARVDVFQPFVGALAGLTARVKYAFDPNGILNPGRMAHQDRAGGLNGNPL